MIKEDDVHRDSTEASDPAADDRNDPADDTNTAAMRRMIRGP